MLSIALESVTIPMPSLQRRVSSTRMVSVDCWLDWIGGKNENLMQLKGAPQMKILLKHLHMYTYMSCTNVRCLFSAALFESQVVSSGQLVETMVFRKRPRFEMAEILSFDYLTYVQYTVFHV